MAVVELPELMSHANYMYHFCSLYWVWSVYQGAILTNFAIVCNVTLKFKLLCIHLDVTIFVGSPFRLPWIFHWRRHRIHHGHLVKVTSISSHSMRDSHPAASRDFTLHARPRPAIRHFTLHERPRPAIRHFTLHEEPPPQHTHTHTHTHTPLETSHSTRDPDLLLATSHSMRDPHPPLGTSHSMRDPNLPLGISHSAIGHILHPVNIITLRLRHCHHVVLSQIT